MFSHLILIIYIVSDMRTILPTSHYRFYPGTTLVRGRARHPQSQGAVERGNGPFKTALQKIMQQFPLLSWSSIGIYRAADSLNKIPSRVRGNHSPYEAFFGQAMKKSPIDVLDQHFVDMCQTEDGLQAAIDLVSSTGIRPSNKDIESCINSADEQFENGFFLL